MMARRSSRGVASIGIRLVDEAYVSRCTAHMQCRTALREWLMPGRMVAPTQTHLPRGRGSRASDRQRLEWLSRLAHIS
jgi:hypothetical protein